MTTTITQITSRPRRQQAASGRHAAAKTPNPGTTASGAQPKPVLTVHARLDVEQARKFVMELDTTAAAASPLLAMFLLGRCAEHAQALLDIVDAVTELPR